MVTLRVIREPSGPDNTFGIMFIDGFFMCHTLENSRKIIPAGNYSIEMYPSPRFKMIVPLLQNVPGRSMIEIHPANWFHELEGCIAPGMLRESNMILQSRVAFGKIMDKIRNVPSCIQIEEWA